MGWKDLKRGTKWLILFYLFIISQIIRNLPNLHGLSLPISLAILGVLATLIIGFLKNFPFTKTLAIIFHIAYQFSLLRIFSLIHYTKNILDPQSSTITTAGLLTIFSIMTVINAFALVYLIKNKTFSISSK